MGAPQAAVEVKNLNKRAARQQLATPVITRRNKVVSVKITIPLLEKDRKGRGTYLIAELPKEMVDDAIYQASKLPEAKRSAFIRKWIRENQKAVLEQYIKVKGEEPKRFRYDVVPVRGTTGMVVTRTEPAPSPVIPREPTLRPRKPKMKSLPKQVKGGLGVPDRPYKVILSSTKRKKTGLEYDRVSRPIKLGIPEIGLSHISLDLDLYISQLTDSNVGKTADEVGKVVRGILEYQIYRRNIRAGPRDIEEGIRSAVSDAKTAVRVMKRKVAEKGAAYLEYIENN